MNIIKKIIMYTIVLSASLFSTACDVEDNDAEIKISSVDTYYDGVYSDPYISFTIKNTGYSYAETIHVSYYLYDGSQQVTSGFESVSILYAGESISISERLFGITDLYDCDRAKFNVSWYEYEDDYSTIEDYYSKEYEFDL